MQVGSLKTLGAGFGATLGLALGAACLLTAAGCSDSESKTTLNPAGPPMVRQVFVKERVTIDSGGNQVKRTLSQLAFGTHSDISLDQDPQNGVSNAVALDQKIRIVIDELLDGSTLEQVACADGTFSDIVPGSTPDDMSDCAGADRRSCTAACTAIGPDNQPVGILDENEDTSADALRFKENIVTLTCGGTEMALILDGLNKTFWNPSGNQQIPAGDVGTDGIGPAIVLIPEGLRTGSNCTIDIADSVVDHDGNPVCAPENGDISKDCSDGDLSRIEWGTQAFALAGSAPLNGQENVALSQRILLQFNLDVDVTTFDANVAISDGTNDVPFTKDIGEDDSSIATLTPTGGLLPNTEYTVTITGGDNGLKEIFGGQLPQDVSLSFTTGDAVPMVDAAPDVDAGAADAATPDAGTPDAGV